MGSWRTVDCYTVRRYCRRAGRSRISIGESSDGGWMTAGDSRTRGDRARLSCFTGSSSGCASISPPGNEASFQTSFKFP